MGSLLKVEARGVHEWQHTVFSLLGIGMVAWKREPRDSLRLQLEGVARKYEDHVVNTHATDAEWVRDEDFDYLQLMGAWLLYYFNDQVSSQRIARFVGTFRPVHDSMYGGGRGRLGWLGYPTLHHSDFGIKRCDNLFLTDGAINRITQGAKDLVSDEAMLSYGEAVYAIHEPRREAHYESVREARERRAQRPPATQPAAEQIPGEPASSTTQTDSTQAV